MAAILSGVTYRIALATSAAQPDTDDRGQEILAALRAAGHARVAVAAYLLAPGRFSDELQLAGADAVSRPIGVHHLLVDLIEQRWRSAIAESLVVSRPKAVND